MMSKIKFAVVVPVALFIVGCGDVALRDRSNEYLHSHELPPMVIPDDKDDAAVGELYAIPDIPETGAVTSDVFRVPRPQPLSENLFEETVTIQSFGADRWIAINKPPAEVWPRIRNILTRSGVPTARTDAPHGILETGWLQFKDDDSNSHRFRFTITPGVGISSTEVRLIQMQVPQGTESRAGEWPQYSSSSERGQEFMEMTSNALVSDINSGSVSLLAQNIGGDSKVKIVTQDQPYISMKLSYERAWSSVVHSLSLGGFSVVDKDQSSGLVIVDFNEAPNIDENKTLFEALIGFTTEVKETEAVNYQVSVSESDEAIEVRISNKQDSSLDRALAMKLLRIIRTNLS